jgi:hypothetical protein
MLTLDVNISTTGETTLMVPNLTVKYLYLERIRELHLPTGKEIDEVRAVAKQLYSRGDIQSLCEFIEREHMQLFDHRDYASANELTIKTVFLMLLAGNIFYILDSETELERGYIEFKFVSLDKLKLSGQQVREKSRKELEKFTEIQKQRAKAEEKLGKYRVALERKYGDILRLCCFSVVAVGFERLLWAEFE